MTGWVAVVLVALAGVGLGTLAGLPHADAQSTGCPTTTSAPCADIAVTQSDSPDPVYAGDQLTYTITVANNGPANAPSSKLVDNLPDTVTFVSADPSQGTCTQSGGVVTCDLGFICSPGGCSSASAAAALAGNEALVTIVVRPNTPGTITNDATGSAKVVDPDSSNSSASEDTTVLNPYKLKLAPKTATNPVGTPHTVTATLKRKGSPLSNRDIMFEVGGVNSASGTVSTDANGQAAFTYSGGNPGHDTIDACFELDTSSESTAYQCTAEDTAEKDWTDYRVSLAPANATNTQGSTHTVVATVTNAGAPLDHGTVLFTVAGANSVSGSDTIGPNGHAKFTYTGVNEGDDTIVACFDVNRNGVCDPGSCSCQAEPQASVAKTWLPACVDGRDNDGDGKIDYPADPGCSSKADPNEADVTACTDGIDNDHDGAIDYPNDPGCSSKDDSTETFDNPNVTPGGGSGGGSGAGSGGGLTTVSPPGGTPVQVVPAHSAGHARFRVAYGRIVWAHGRHYFVIRVRSQRANRVRLRIRMTYRHGRVRRATRTLRTNRRVKVTGLHLAGVRRVRLTVLG